MTHDVILQAGFLALLPSLVGLGTSIFGGVKQAVSGSAADPSIKAAQDQAAKATQQGTNVLNQSAATTAPAKSFFASILGNRENALSALAPQVSTLVDQYDAGRKALQEFSPRGGGRVAQANELPFQEAGKISDILQTARAGAANNLATIGGQERGTGAGLIGEGTSALGRAAGTAIEQQKAKNQQWAQIGSGIGSSLTSLVGQIQKNKQSKAGNF